VTRTNITRFPSCGNRNPRASGCRSTSDHEWKKQPHEGENAPRIIQEILDFSKKAQDEILAAGPVTKNKEEFQRLQGDVYCIV